jgi:hypothetical protein
MAPMASEIANGEKDRFVLLARFFEGLLSPRIPVNGIVGVQEQIGTFRVNEPVGVTVLSCLVSWLGGWNLLGLRGSVGAGRGLRGSVHRGRKDKEQYAGAKQLELFIGSAQFHRSDQRSTKSNSEGLLPERLLREIRTHALQLGLPSERRDLGVSLFFPTRTSSE